MSKAKEELFDFDPSKSESETDQESTLESTTTRDPSGTKTDSGSETTNEKESEQSKQDGNGTSIEIKLKFENVESSKQINDTKPVIEMSVSNKDEGNGPDQENATNSEDIVDKINEIKQKQLEINEAKESIISKLSGKNASSSTVPDAEESTSLGTTSTTLASSDETNDNNEDTTVVSDSAEDLASKIKEIKSKEKELSMAKEKLFDIEENVNGTIDNESETKESQEDGSINLVQEP